MRKHEKEVLQIDLENEKRVLKQLEEIYRQALEDVNEKIKLLQWDQEAPSKIYQKRYQEQLKKQLEAILRYMSDRQYTTIEEYLRECYELGFVGTLYSMQQEGVPLIFPIDQAAAIKAIQTDSKINKGLYAALGVDADKLKKTIASEVTRGIATNMAYRDIARNISNVSNAPLSRAKLIARTEAHRIQNASRLDCIVQAKKRGANVVKVWDATLDGVTRPTHRNLDGQIREIDKPFEADGKKAMYPGDFGDPAEDCNCRCVMLEKARWELDADETKYLGRTENMTDDQLRPIAEKLHIPVSELRQYSGQIIPVRAKNYADFKRQYDQIWNYETSELKKQVDARKAGAKK